MQRRTLLIFLVMMPLSRAVGQTQSGKTGIPVEIVATASEYVPRSTTVSHAGHSYTNCLGTTNYFGRFNDYGGFASVSGTAETATSCNTTFSPPTETTLTTYLRINYIIAKDDHSLYLLACTQRRTPTGGQMAGKLIGAIAAGGAGRQRETSDDRGEGTGKWSKCPEFSIGSRYILSARNTSEARLETPGERKSNKLDYLSSAPLPPAVPKPETQSPVPAVMSSATALVHVISSPSGGEIYVDGKFFGNTPSDITLAVGEHLVEIAHSGRKWSRTVQITPGDVYIHGDITEK